MVKKNEEHTTFEVGPISEPRMRDIMTELWQAGGAGREALREELGFIYLSESKNPSFFEGGKYWWPVTDIPVPLGASIGYTIVPGEYGERWVDNPTNTTLITALGQWLGRCPAPEGENFFYSDFSLARPLYFSGEVMVVEQPTDYTIGKYWRLGLAFNFKRNDEALIKAPNGITYDGVYREIDFMRGANRGNSVLSSRFLAPCYPITIGIVGKWVKVGEWLPIKVEIRELFTYGYNKMTLRYGGTWRKPYMDSDEFFLNGYYLCLEGSQFKARVRIRNCFMWR